MDAAAIALTTLKHREIRLLRTRRVIRVAQQIAGKSAQLLSSLEESIGI
jgi:hypothetical protein